MTDIDHPKVDGPYGWKVRLVIEFNAYGPARADDVAAFAGGSAAHGAVDLRDAECQVFALDGDNEVGPFYRSTVYRETYDQEFDADGF